MKNIPLILCLVFLVFSCKKPENRSCFKFIGKQVEKVVPLTAFDKVKLYGHIEYSIIQDSTDQLVIIGGQNLVNFIEATNEGGLLTIQNKNKCNFLRNEKKVVKVEIHCTSISNIHFEGTEPLNTVGQLKSDYLNLFIRDGAGPVNLNIKSIYIIADISHGWGDYTLTGTAQVAGIGAKSNGFCDVRGLTITDSLYVSSESVGDIHVNASNIPLYGYIKSSGNIYYSGIPNLISVVQTGSGKVLSE